MKFSTMKLELEKRCLDLGQIKRPEARYGEAINYSLSQYPLPLWQLALDETTLDTVEDQREYDLTAAGKGKIAAANQVRRIWIDDDDGVKREVGRYEVQDDEGTLTLVLDEPPTGAYDITIEYWTPPTELSGDLESTVDDEWLLARAMVYLTGEADWTIEDPQQVIARLQYWNARLVQRERQLLAQRRHTSRRPRTTAWRQYVT